MALQGAIPVEFGHVFPHGAYVLSVQPVRDFDKSTREHTVQEREKETGELVWSVEVIDADPEARESTVRVKIAAPVQPWTVSRGRSSTGRALPLQGRG